MRPAFASSDPADHLRTERFETHTVLVVSGIPDQLEPTSILLQKSGYLVLTAGNGIEGFERAQDEHPALVISDVSLPGMNGIELCRRLRADPYLHQTPVLLISAFHQGDGSVVEGLKAGADDYMEAPYNPMRLITRVAQLIERKQSEEEIRAAEDKYRVVAETATDVIVTIDENGKILFINKSLKRVFGYEIAEVLGKDVTLLLGERMRSALKAALSKYLETGEKNLNWEAVELAGLHKSGREIPLELSLAEFVKNGKCYLTAIARDISERKRAEQALRKSEERYRDLVENARDIIYTHDLDGNYLGTHAKKRSR